MEKLLRPSEAAEQLNVSTALLAQWRYEETGPKFVKISPRKVFYTQPAIDEYVERSTRQSTAVA